MQDLINLVSEAAQKEVNSAVITKLPQDFYGIVAMRLKQLKLIESTATSELTRKAALELRTIISDIIDELINLRMRKFMSMKLQGEPVELDEYETSIAKQIMLAINESESFKSKLKDGLVKELQNQYKQAEPFYSLVLFKSNVDKFVGVDIKEYGPFNEGDISMIPEENAKILIDKGLVIMVGEL
jgi:DNA replication initiation complex subunit (GINS family)